MCASTNLAEVPEMWILRFKGSTYARKCWNGSTLISTVLVELSSSSLSLSKARSDGKSTESVSSYEYLGIRIDDELSFKIHIANLVRKLKNKEGLLF